MASGSAIRIYHGTLAASTVDTVTLSVLNRTVTVVNRGTGDIFVTTGDDVHTAPTPTVGGAEEWVVPSNSTVTIPVAAPTPALDQGATLPSKTVAKLISSGTPAYSVIA